MPEKKRKEHQPTSEAKLPAASSRWRQSSAKHLRDAFTIYQVTKSNFK